MADLSFFIGILGNVISILVFASPITTFRRVVKNKSTERFKGIPYVITLLSTSMWTYYGLLKPGGLLVVTVNGAGSVMQAVYVTLFLIYAPKDTRMKMGKLALLLNVASFSTVVLITLFAIHGTTRLTVIGFMCAGLTIGMYASPLAAMRTVVKTKSVEYMPFFLTFFLFLNGGVWSVYSFLVTDYFIGLQLSSSGACGGGGLLSAKVMVQLNDLATCGLLSAGGDGRVLHRILISPTPARELSFISPPYICTDLSENRSSNVHGEFHHLVLVLRHSLLDLAHPSMEELEKWRHHSGLHNELGKSGDGYRKGAERSAGCGWTMSRRRGVVLLGGVHLLVGEAGEECSHGLCMRKIVVVWFLLAVEVVHNGEGSCTMHMPSAVSRWQGGPR